MAPKALVRYVLSAREWEVLRTSISDKPRDKETYRRSVEVSSATQDHDFNAAAFRTSSRVFVATAGTIKIVQAILDQLQRRRARSNAQPRKPLIASPQRFALSISALLYFHRILFRLLKRLRSQLLHDKVRNIRQRYPRIYTALTSKIAPAIGASLSGLALGICTADQLRVTIAIYVACRALELTYAGLESAGYTKNKPWWFGSWLLFPLAQGQLLHAFLFDRDCFPEAYGSFILSYTPEYIQPRPAALSSKVTWPSSNQIVEAIADIARSHWPPFVSPILHPNNANTIPSSINSVISPITSRAHPAHQHLSCALLHPAELSCFMAYLRQNLLAFPRLARFFTMYYGAFSILRIKQSYKTPLISINRLSQQILKTTLAISGAIGAAWGSICLFAAIFPRSFLPKFRFFLGGLLGGLFQLFDRTPAGHGNALYAARTSVDSLWKVGIKRRWWKPVKGGDVWLVVISLALVNAVYDLAGQSEVGKDRAFALIRLLRGEAEIGLQTKKEDKKAE